MYWQDVLFYIILLVIIVGFFFIKKPQPPGGKRSNKRWGQKVSQLVDTVDSEQNGDRD